MNKTLLLLTFLLSLSLSSQKRNAKIFLKTGVVLDGKISQKNSNYLKYWDENNFKSKIPSAEIDKFYVYDDSSNFAIYKFKIVDRKLNRPPILVKELISNENGIGLYQHYNNINSSDNIGNDFMYFSHEDYCVGQNECFTYYILKKEAYKIIKVEGSCGFSKSYSIVLRKTLDCPSLNKILKNNGFRKYIKGKYPSAKSSFVRIQELTEAVKYYNNKCNNFEI